MRPPLVTCGLYLLVLLLMLAGCTTPPAPTTGATPPLPPVFDSTPASSDQAALMEFVLTELAKAGKQDRYIARVEYPDAANSVVLRPTSDTVRQCWFSQVGSVKECAPKDFLESYRQGDPISWQHRYTLFAIVSVDREYTHATIRLDWVSGPAAAITYSISVARVNGQWREQSREVIGVS